MKAQVVSLRLTTAIAQCALVVFGLVANPACGVELQFDLDWNGPDTSYAEECLHDGSCSKYPIIGTIGIRLEPSQPYLENLDSTLITLPGAPPNPVAEFAWQRLDWTIGEYLSDPSLPNVSMWFYPNPVLDTVHPLYQMFVDLSDGRTKLTLTGGRYPLFPPPQNPASVTFVVNGRPVPEPGALGLAAAAVAVFIANHRRR